MPQVYRVDKLTLSPYLRFIYCEDYTSSNPQHPYIIPWRSLYDYEIIFMVSGSLEVETETDKYTLTAGDIHVMAPFKRHRRIGTNFKLYSIHCDMIYTGQEYDFSADEVYLSHTRNTSSEEEIQEDEKLKHRPYHAFQNTELPQKLKVSEPLKYIEILTNAQNAYINKLPGYELDLKIYLMQLMRLIDIDMRLAAQERPLDKETKISNCVDYLKKHFNEDVDLKALAEQNGMSYAYFRKQFKKMLGVSPNEYLIEQRINTAILYMRTHSYSISEIAKIVGYDDLHYFSRLFKKKRNCAPSEYLKKIYSLKP